MTLLKGLFSIAKGPFLVDPTPCKTVMGRIYFPPFFFLSKKSSRVPQK